MGRGVDDEVRIDRRRKEGAKGKLPRAAAGEPKHINMKSFFTAVPTEGSPLTLGPFTSTWPSLGVGVA